MLTNNDDDDYTYLLGAYHIPGIILAFGSM